MLFDIRNHPVDRVAAIDSDGKQLSYGEICSFADKLEHLLKPHSLYFMLTENNVGGIAWTISGILSGNVPLLLNAHQDDGLVDNLIEIYKPPFIVLPASCSEKYPDCESVATLFGYTLLATGYPHVKMNNLLSHLLPTSGSTGSPKLVRHKYENIEAAALNISTFFGIKESDRPLMVLPLYYTMGLSMVFSHFKKGACVLITGESMMSPKFWSFMKEQRASSFTGVPFSFKILDQMRIYRRDYPDLKLLTQGGGKMERDLNLKFATWCQETGREWIATYGQSEGTARMAYLPPKWAVEKAGSIGVAVPNGHLWLVDQDGNEIIEPFVNGEMCYAGKNVTMGYASCQEDLLKGDERNGSMRTGDMAYFDKDGCFYIVGRLGRFLKLYGKRVGLDESEQIVRDALSIECACTGDDEKMLVFTTAKDRDRDILSVLVDKTGMPATAFEIRVIEEMPKNEAGKILYRLLGSCKAAEV